MSGLNSEQKKQSNELESSLPGLIQLMTKLVEQNSILIEQAAAKEQIFLQLIEQHDELLSELVDQENGDTGSTFLDD